MMGNVLIMFPLTNSSKCILYNDRPCYPWITEMQIIVVVEFVQTNLIRIILCLTTVECVTLGVVY